MRHAFVAAATAALLFAGGSHAITLAADGNWAPFDIDELSATSGDLEWIDIASGAALRFDFTVAAGQQARLTVVDGGFAGDRFLVTDGIAVLGKTSAPGLSYPGSVGLDFDTALADARYSNGTFELGAGVHSITGYLIRSVSLDGVALNATVGAVRLEISPVPEPASTALLLVGLALLGATLKRHRQ